MIRPQPTKVLEEGANTLSKEETRLAQRQTEVCIHKDYKQLWCALENKTHQHCRETGKLIPAERLRAVPHAYKHQAKNNGKK